MSAEEGSGIIVPKTKQPAKAVCQVITALKNSNNAEGPTMAQIVKFIFNVLHKPATKRQIMTALKRGIEFGLITRKKGHYLISSPQENFAKLMFPIKKTRIARFREPSKILDKVSKRAPMITKGRRNVKNSRTDCRISSLASATTLYDPDRE